MIIKDLLNFLPQHGTVEWIGLRPYRKAELEVVDHVEVSVENGFKDDHYSKKYGDRMVTLIQLEHLESVSKILKIKEIDPKLSRRNIVVSGINLLALHNRKFHLGDEVILQGTGYCHPCSRMEQNLGAGGYNAMRGHGGITAKIIAGGIISLGDIVRINSE